MKIKSLKVNTKQKKYSIYFNNNLVNEINEILDKENLKFEKFLIVYDSKIKKHTVEEIFKKIKEIIITINAGTVIHKPKILAEELVNLSLGTKNLK